MTFGERLYKLRNDNNISQEELADLLDVSRQSISKWENDKAYPEITRLLFLSEYFHVSLDYLMRGTEQQNSPEEPYRTKSMLSVWNDFYSNLSGKQKNRFALLYVLIVCASLAIVIAVIYLGGYEIGKFFAYLTK
ncbi:MAG: helix-turn-helix transcriptional regulator [Erysipelotrichaceae bacterium]|nr:helix-turn-helix transcriptional regulator [Erysipelotrichaceae bacterium]